MGKGTQYLSTRRCSSDVTVTAEFHDLHITDPSEDDLVDCAADSESCDTVEDANNVAVSACLELNESYPGVEHYNVARAAIVFDLIIPNDMADAKNLATLRITYLNDRLEIFYRYTYEALRRCPGAN